MNRSAIRSTRSRARSGFVRPPLTANAASTGNATGRDIHGSVTMIAAMTQLFPNPSLADPAADPS